MTALAPIATGSPSAEGVTLELYDGTFDRLTIVGWARVINAGSAAPFISLEEADGTPVVQLFKGGANGLLFKAWGDGGTYPFLDGNYRFGADGVFSASEWRWFHVNLNPTGYLIQVWDAAGNLIDSTQDASFGTPPTNHPILQGISTLRIGGAAGSGGQVALDDLRIIRNYLNPLALTTLRTTHVTQEPIGMVPATLEVTAGSADAGGGTATFRGGSSITASAGAATADGGTARFTAGGTLTTEPGGAAAAGGTATLRAGARLEVLPGAALAGGALAAFTAGGTLTVSPGGAVAAGGDVVFGAPRGGTLVTSPGGAIAAGGLVTLRGGVLPPIPSVRTLTGGVRRLLTGGREHRLTLRKEQG